VTAHTEISIRRLVLTLSVLALLLVVINPELRLLVIFVDSVGLELILLFLSLQLRSVTALVTPWTQNLETLACSVASSLGLRALRAFHGALALRRLDRIVCSFLIFISYGLSCHVSRRYTRPHWWRRWMALAGGWVFRSVARKAAGAGGRGGRST